MSRLRTYEELSQFTTFEERFQYLSLGQGGVGEKTFGAHRDMNQRFYHSSEWRWIREEVIARDEGCDLGVPGYDIHENDRIYIHHMNPMVIADIEHGNSAILNPRFLISVTHTTHNAIHYGDVKQIPRQFVERKMNDHIPWR